MSEIEIRLREAIKQAAQKGFGNYRFWTCRGDSNCPHPVTYSPKDGHGFEEKDLDFDLNSDGVTAAFDGDDDYVDPMEVLCRLFESLPKIEERELIK